MWVSKPYLRWFDNKWPLLKENLENPSVWRPVGSWRVYRILLECEGKLNVKLVITVPAFWSRSCCCCECQSVLFQSSDRGDEVALDKKSGGSSILASDQYCGSDGSINRRHKFIIISPTIHHTVYFMMLKCEGHHMNTHVDRIKRDLECFFSY